MWDLYIQIMMKHINIIQDIKAKTLSYNIQDNIALINKKTYNNLKSKLNDDNNIVRLSLHKNADELTQSMLIAIRKDAIIKEHKNINKDKIYHIIEGIVEFELLTFGKYIVKENEIFKLGKNQFASMKALSDIAIYNEIVAGPFSKTDTVYIN